ncbi:MAG: 4Fe-4S binding protein [Clostridiales bacterium]|nr:4Fe-4S binding protein [Clostridiales bacterium]
MPTEAILHTEGMSRCIGCYTCMLVCAGVNRQDHSLDKSAIKIKTSGGMTGRFVAAVCVACREERPCKEACPTGALDNHPGGGVLLHNDLCIGCQRCARACPVGAVFFDEDTKTPIICRHCGMCAKYCPHECLQMEGI